mgnify:CR=1 FL=1
MPATLSYPGVYIEEVPSGVRTIAGVSTSDTAFVDFFNRGPVNDPVRITSFGDFERVFGGLDRRSPASYAIQQYYLNGGQIAYVVRVTGGAAAKAQVVLSAGATSIVRVEAANAGIWGQSLRVTVTQNGALFNLAVEEVVNGTVAGNQLNGGQAVNSEQFFNLSMDSASQRYAVDVVSKQSQLVALVRLSPANNTSSPDPVSNIKLTGNAADDGTAPTANDLKGSSLGKTGIHALEKIAPFVFNILCIPAAAELAEADMRSVYTEALSFCESKRAFLLVDIPETTSTITLMNTWLTANANLRSDRAAVYFPRLEIPDSLNGNRPRNVAASGTLAGIYARTDATRGIWKAPAGTEAVMRNASVALKLNDLENGGLNQQGANVLRNFPVYGNISWGARTLNGADQQASEYKYIPVRRLALYIEESLYQGLKWVVFEPNDEPLWAQVRLNVGAFMNNLFRQGAFQGRSSREAYFVKCDKETTTQNDIDRGIVNILVGFAPLKPAEFVVVKLQQIAGQVQV